MSAYLFFFFNYSSSIKHEDFSLVCYFLVVAPPLACCLLLDSDCGSNIYVQFDFRGKFLLYTAATALEAIQSCFRLTHFGILYIKPKLRSCVLTATDGSSCSGGPSWYRCTPDILRCAMRKYLKMLGVICITLSTACYMQKKEQSYLQVTIYW